jgi:hypothetical protein
MKINVNEQSLFLLGLYLFASNYSLMGLWSVFVVPRVIWKGGFGYLKSLCPLPKVLSTSGSDSVITWVPDIINYLVCFLIQFHVYFSEDWASRSHTQRTSGSDSSTVKPRKQSHKKLRPLMSEGAIPCQWPLSIRLLYFDWPIWIAFRSINCLPVITLYQAKEIKQSFHDSLLYLNKRPNLQSLSSLSITSHSFF